MGAVDRQTRREFMAQAAAVGGVLASSGFIAACGGGSSSGSAGSSGGGIVKPSGPADLKFVGWQGYDAKPASKYPRINGWMAQNKISLTSTYSDTNEAMLTKIQASPSGTYDLTSPYHGTVPTMIAAGVLEPIETDRMRNFASVYPQIRSLSYLHGPEGKVYAVPLDFSYSVGLYDAGKVQPLQRFADVLTNPSLKGRYTLIDAPEHFTWIAQYLGLGNPDPHHLTAAQLKQCQSVARKVITNARAMPSSFGDCLQLLLTHEVEWSLSGNPSDQETAQSKGVNIRSFLPSQGAQAYIDNYCIPKGTSNYDNALAWIDYVHSPRGEAEIQKAYGTGAVTPQAVQYLEPNLRKLYDYANISDAFKNAPVWPPIPVKTGKYASYADWTQAWDQSK
jgi:spermidine/putrescine transport system substrate-binding protein